MHSALQRALTTRAHVQGELGFDAASMGALNLSIDERQKAHDRSSDRMRSKGR